MASLLPDRIEGGSLRGGAPPLGGGKGLLGFGEVVAGILRPPRLVRAVVALLAATRARWGPGLPLGLVLNSVELLALFDLASTARTGVWPLGGCWVGGAMRAGGRF